MIQLNVTASAELYYGNAKRKLHVEHVTYVEVTSCAKEMCALAI
jgi:hypothetical protein